MRVIKKELKDEFSKKIKKFKGKYSRKMRRCAAKNDAKTDGLQSARYNRIRYFGWRSSRNCYSCNRSVQAKTARALERDSRRHEIALARKVANRSGQSTVEFAIVAVVVLILILGISALMHKLDAGVFVDHAITSSSHNITNSSGGPADVFVY